jgi:hypothetical protein
MSRWAATSVYKLAARAEPDSFPQKDGQHHPGRNCNDDGFWGTNARRLSPTCFAAKEIFMTDHLLNRIKRYDEERPGIPGEHWLALAGAMALWLSTRRHRSMVVRLLGSVAGTALVARAVSGRKVPAQLVRWLPFEQGEPDKRG